MFDLRLWRLRTKKLLWVIRQSDRIQLLKHGIAPSLEHLEMFKGHSYATVVDVGANLGQFALFALEHLSPQQIVCIEPLPNRFDYLAKRAAAIGCELSVFAVALSNRNGSGTLRQTCAGDNSSLLHPTRSAIERSKGLKVKREVDVPLRRADELLTSQLPKPILLKLDVQGTELEALRGATEFIQTVDTVLVEVSFGDFYDGQCTPREVLTTLFDENFNLIATSLVPGTGKIRWELHQADFLFKKQTPLKASSME